MTKLILAIIGIVTVFALVLTALGGRIGDVETILLTVLLIASVVTAVVRYRKSLQNK